MKSLKEVISVLAAIVKAKSTVMKSKTSSIKTRLMLFKLLHNKTVLMSVLSRKVHTFKADEKVKDYSESVLSYKPTCNHLVEHVEEEQEEEEYLNPTNPFLELDQEGGNEFKGGAGSVTDFLSSQEDETFSFENEIDKAADVFIRRFHRQIKIQKQESFKRYQEMLECWREVFR